MELELRINGVIESLDIAPNESLLTLLRHQGYCSLKQGCDTGECGACTVLVEGVARPSCVMLAAQAGGCSLTTAESLGSVGKLHPLQTAFIEVGAVQCGFCTPGMLMSAYALLQREPAPTEEMVRDALSGNLCRCNGYAKPVQAVLRAAAMMRGESVAPLEQKIIKLAETANGVPGKAVPVLAATAAHTTATTSKMPVLNAETIEYAARQHDQQLQAVGKAIPPLNAAKLVMGKAVFAGDLTMPGMLYGRLLTSPHAHAIIRTIDVTQAKALPGVHAVLTYKDVPRVPYSSAEQFQPDSSRERIEDCYCLDARVRYVGDRVAIVAAETEELAEQALKLIEVEYDVLPAILDPRQALDPSAPVLHPEEDSRGIFNASRNIAARLRTEVGDVDQGFAVADLVVEGEYFMSPSEAVPLEPHTVLTSIDEDGILVVRTSSQVAQHVRRTLAQILGLQARHIRVITPEIGGSFGAKQELLLEDLSALLTLSTNRPVKLTFSRAEAFQNTHIRSQHIIRLKTGVMRDGTIIANQMILLASTGSHGTHALMTQPQTQASALALYPCVHMRFVAEVLYTNHAPAAAFQGNGTLQEFFALESHIDEIASRLDIDALELRRKNWLKAGDRYPFVSHTHARRDSLPMIESCALPTCLQLVEEKLRWSEKRGKHGLMNGRFRHGVGAALALQGSAAGLSDLHGAQIKLNEDGSFDIFVNVSDGGIGTGTLIVQIAAEVLGVASSDILLHTTETAATPFATGSGDAATLYGAGGVVKKAAEQARRQILSVAGRMLNVLPESLKISKGILLAPDGRTVPLARIAEHALSVEKRQIMTTASLKMAHTPATFSAQGVSVEVDTETGTVHVLKAITAVDVGNPLNPLILETQIQGSVTQALSIALTEELFYDQAGTLLTTSLSEYHVYSAPEMPEIQTYLVESDEPTAPFGAKAVAAVPLYGLAPAIANAVADALGIRIRQLPLSPERVLRAIHAHTTKKP